jgi:hypothetical protein
MLSITDDLNKRAKERWKDFITNFFTEHQKSYDAYLPHIKSKKELINPSIEELSQQIKVLTPLIDIMKKDIDNLKFIGTMLKKKNINLSKVMSDLKEKSKNKNLSKEEHIEANYCYNFLKGIITIPVEYSKLSLITPVINNQIEKFNLLVKHNDSLYEQRIELGEQSENISLSPSMNRR